MISTLYYIKHPLRFVNQIPTATVAAFTDADVDEYCREYDKYEKAQRESVEEISRKIEECRKLMSQIFDTPEDRCSSKQVKYLDREVRKGGTCVDKHSMGIPHKAEVIQLVTNARNFVSALPRSEIEVFPLSDEQLANQDSAVKFLESKGYVLGTDFTKHNAVRIAEALVHNNLALHFYSSSTKATQAGTTPIAKFPYEYFLTKSDYTVIRPADFDLNYSIDFVSGSARIQISRSNDTIPYYPETPESTFINNVAVPYCWHSVKIKFGHDALTPIIILVPIDQ